MGKVRKKEKPSIEDSKTGTREKIANALELPKEIVLNLPKVILVGNKSVVIQNYKGIFLFEDDTVKINTCSGIVAVHGRKLKIIEINTEDLCVEGRIKSVEFMS
jgi:sporulation protein YqfC